VWRSSIEKVGKIKKTGNTQDLTELRIARLECGEVRLNEIGKQC
jgi:hypothetical protein